LAGRIRQAALPPLAVVLVLCAGTAAPAATLFDPALRFRVLSTDHFLIYFHQHEEPLARRLAGIAEDVWLTLQEPLGAVPPRLTHVVLLDQTDLPNGSATPVPYNTVVLTAAWPAGSDFIGNIDDWLRTVFTHEFTHVVHLDRSKGWARVVRNIFGRTPIAFPNLFLPVWQIEGLATYEESMIAGGGRLHAGDFRAIVAEAAQSRRSEPLDRINGGLTDWPGGLSPYAYGTGFHAYLADTYGADRLAAVASQTSGRIPFTASRVFRRVYGKSLGVLWDEYEGSFAARAGGPPTVTDGATRLTRSGFIVTGPRFDQQPCAGCPRRIVYSVMSPHGFPSLNVIDDGSTPSRLTTRYFGATAAVRREFIVFDQLERRRNAGLYSDLYMFDRRSGRVRRLTSEARLLDPDLSPTGQTLVCVQSTAGRRDLVLVRLNRSSVGPTLGQTAEIETLLSETEAQFNAPKWSPDGRSIAVERHRLGALSEIVIVDVATKAVRIIASDPHARLATPAWRPDGRAIVAAVAPEEAPFNLYEFPLDIGLAPRQLTHTTGGAMWPDVAPDGKSIVFVGYTTEGFDLFLMPYPSLDGSPAGVAQDSSPARDVAQDFSPAAGNSGSTTGPAIAYRPWRTLKPTSWSPIVVGDSHQVRVGPATGGSDVLGYHTYAASATWLVSGPADARIPNAAAPDWQIGYAYNRWRPSLWVTASRDTTFFAGPAADDGATSAETRRTDQVEAGVLLPIHHVRASQTTLVSVLRASDRLLRGGRAPSLNRTGFRAAWRMTSAQMYGYSISPERGITFGATVEAVRRAFGSSADADAWTSDARFYLPSFARQHVVALRLAAGGSAGDSDLQRIFQLGGAAPNTSVTDFGSDAITLLRAFGTGAFAGTHVALFNAEYRWPLARPQRGIGTWPLFLHTAHAAAFVDAGQTWTRRFDATNVKTSAGIELSGNLIAGYRFPYAVTGGIARGHDGSGAIADGWTLYFRIGRAF
jgi:hypothetical protein